MKKFETPVLEIITIKTESVTTGGGVVKTSQGEEDI